MACAHLFARQVHARCTLQEARNVGWALGSCLHPNSRIKFEELLRKVSGRHLSNISLYD